MSKEEIAKVQLRICERAIERLNSDADELEASVLGKDRPQHFLLSGEMDIAPLWEKLIDTCMRLESLAHKQLRGVKFSEAEAHFIRDEYGSTLASIMLYGGNSYYTPNDDAARAIDVFTNPTAAPNSRYLEVGVARARAIYVLYPYEDTLVLCAGAVMPYYEFKHGERLTDKEWKALLDSDQRPDRPAWLQPIQGKHLPSEKRPATR